jgi:hypothetical protein
LRFDRGSTTEAAPYAFDSFGCLEHVIDGRRVFDPELVESLEKTRRPRRLSLKLFFDDVHDETVAAHVEPPGPAIDSVEQGLREMHARRHEDI